jgi:hypothetical protein
VFSIWATTARRRASSCISDVATFTLSALKAIVRPSPMTKMMFWVRRLYHPDTRSIELLNQVSRLA